MRCEKCGTTVNNSDLYEHAGQKICEDCYLDIVAAPKTCDPWAVHSAKSMAKDSPVLTPIQNRILSLIKEKGKLSAEEVCSQLGITEKDFQNNFATLRHMELARACKEGDRVFYTLFESK